MVNKNKNLDHDLSQYVVFSLKDQKFGINVLESREIITIEEGLTNIPDSPSFVKGVINLRKEIIPIIDTEKKFGLNSDVDFADKKVIIVSIQENLVGLLVDEVIEILRVEKELISDAPEIVKNIKQKYISGIAKLEDRLLVLLDTKKLFSNKEIEKINNMDIK